MKIPLVRLVEFDALQLSPNIEPQARSGADISAVNALELYQCDGHGLINFYDMHSTGSGVSPELLAVAMIPGAISFQAQPEHLPCPAACPASCTVVYPPTPCPECFGTGRKPGRFRLIIDAPRAVTDAEVIALPEEALERSGGIVTIRYLMTASQVRPWPVSVDRGFDLGRPELSEKILSCAHLERICAAMTDDVQGRQAMVSCVLQFYAQIDAAITALLKGVT